MTDEPAEALPVTATVTAVAPVALDPIALKRIAQELAFELRDLDEILPDFHLTHQDFHQYIEVDPVYKAEYEKAREEWNRADNANKRLQLKSAYSLEFILPNLTARANDPKEALTSVTETAKLFAKMARAGEDDTGGTRTGDKFTITINLGADEKLRYERNLAPNTKAGDAKTISLDAGGESVTRPVQSLDAPS